MLNYISMLLAISFVDSPPAAPLTIGDPAPKLATMAYVKGDPVAELRAGTSYVIEFSGTQCAPCTKFIPQLDALQKKYTDVVFISVYSYEKEDVVREFVKSKAGDSSFRVAADPEGVMGKTWSVPAVQVGIPHVFVVDKQGKIIWIGSPYEMAEPLARIVAGKFDPQEQAIRIKVEQLAGLKNRRISELEEKGDEERIRIHKLIAEGKLTEALPAADRALVAFKSAPFAMEVLQMQRLWILGNLADKRNEAFEYGVELAVEAKERNRPGDLVGLSAQLLSVAERADPKLRDRRLIDLALVLLRATTSTADAGKLQPESDKERVDKLWLLAKAYHLREDRHRAVEAVRDAMTILEATKPPAGIDASKFSASTERQLRQFREALSKYAAETHLPDKK